MNNQNKTKNNIIIISIAILSVLTVICVVLITGFAKKGRTSESGESSLWEEYSQNSTAADVQSEPEESSSSVDENSSDASSGDISGSANVGQRIADSATALIGSPFVLNGDSPNGFDNSGFIYYVLRQNGFITCPRTTDAQSRMGARIERDKIKTGDLVFFELEGSGEADFGGIYIGNGKMVASLNPDTNVVEVDITTDYYTASFYGGISLS